MGSEDVIVYVLKRDQGVTFKEYKYVPLNLTELMEEMKDKTYHGDTSDLIKFLDAIKEMGE